MGDKNLFDQDKSGANDLDQLTPEQLLEGLVGEGKKFGSVEDLAKSYAYSQQHISTLESENKTYKEQVDKGRVIDDILAQLGQKPTENGTGETTPPSQGDDKGTPDIEALIAQEFAKRDEANQKKAAEGNVQTFLSEMRKLYGDQAAAVFAQREKDLGINIDQIAAKSPNAALAFFNNTGNGQSFNNARPNGSTPPAATVASTQTKEGLDKLFKDGKISRDEKFRLQHEAISKDPDAYYGRK